MTKDDLAARLLAAFTGELEEQVQAMNADLLALETQPENPERLKSLFRAAHTLKGAARAANVPPVEHACHALEDLLAEARKGRLHLAPEHFQLLFAAADALGEAARRLRSGQDLSDSALALVRDGLSGIGARATPPRAAPQSPPAGGLTTASGDGQVRVEAQRLDALLASTGQLVVAGSRLADRSAELQALHDFAARWSGEWRRTSRRLRLALERSGVSAAAARSLSAVEDNLRRIVHDSGGLAASAAEDGRALAQVTDQVAGRVRRLRMRPFREACEALPRAVRDLAAATGKEVQLAISGGDVEADRAVLDGLREALLQLVRNAVDHGIEPPAAREAAAKPRAGNVTIAAVLRGDRIFVTVADDGAGLDTAVIREHRARQGLPVPADDHDLGRTLFEGGVSTRAAPGPLSGRGVGLDIVRAAVERIRGIVGVAWADGRGTTFTLECPPTLATVRAVLVAVGSQVVAIPTAQVERLLRVRPEEIKHAEGRDVVATAGGPVPIVALARLLPPLTERPVSGPVAAVLLAAGERRVAAAVDDLLAEQEVILRPLGRGRQPLPHVSGAALLGTGRVALVLNPVPLVAAGLALAAGAGLVLAESKPAGPAKPRILVVDDSITTRTLEQSILEAAGYDVRTAVDGSDGWRALQEHGCDLVVADIEMPRMDGFALCEAVRASKRFKEVPVVLVTALETAEHRARGLEVGADAFIGKSSFDQQNLLDTVRQLLG